MRTAKTPVHARIGEDSKYKNYFLKCIGALDGTHIAASVPTAMAPPYRNRKGYLSQNVLGVCNFNMEFTYVLAGWEGSAHDGRVLDDALFNGGLQIPSDRYLLADAGYSNSDYTPYSISRSSIPFERASSCKSKAGK